MLTSFFLVIIISTLLTVPGQPSPRFHVQAWLPFRNCEMDYSIILTNEEQIWTGAPIQFVFMSNDYDMKSYYNLIKTKEKIKKASRCIFSLSRSRFPSRHKCSLWGGRGSFGDESRQQLPGRLLYPVIKKIFDSSLILQWYKF